MAETGYTLRYEVIGAGGRKFKLEMKYNCLRDSAVPIDLGTKFPIPPPKPGASQLDKVGKGSSEDNLNQWVRQVGVVEIG